MEKSREEVMAAIKSAAHQISDRELPLELEVSRAHIKRVADYIKRHPELGAVYGDAFLKCDQLTTLDVVVRDMKRAEKLVGSCYDEGPMNNVKNIRLPMPLQELGYSNI